MKSAIIAASFLATLVLSKPLEKRARAVVWDMETVTVTVTGTQGGWGMGGWNSWATSTAVAIASSAPIAVPTTTVASVIPIVAASSSAPAVVSSASVATVATSAASSTATSDLSSYAAPILAQHNLHRTNHSAPALAWDDDMASIAATIAASCVYAHDTTTGGGGYGQNIGAGALPADIPAMITNEMYNGEMTFYPGYGSEPDMSNFEKWGHFSQIVWADTTGVGCATQYCPGGLSGVGSDVAAYFTVCNYSPAGNFGGEYAKNVLAPLGEATVTA